VPGPSSPPRRADARRNRTAVVEAAGTLLATQGLAMQVEDVASTAGVGVATIYRHFGSRDGLIREVLAARTATMIELIHAATDALDDAEAFAQAVRVIAGELARERGMVDVALRFRAAHDDADPAYTALMEVTEALLRRGQRAGAVRADLTIDELNALLIAAGTATADDASRRRVCDVIIAGVRPAPSLR
jgi:AcrR family transcriptional regulator